MFPVFTDGGVAAQLGRFEAHVHHDMMCLLINCLSTYSSSNHLISESNLFFNVLKRKMNPKILVFFIFKQFYLKLQNLHKNKSCNLSIDIYRYLITYISRINTETWIL